MPVVSGNASEASILVTVGTTGYDLLVEAVDAARFDAVTYQIGPGQFLPRSGTYFRFRERLSEDFSTFDLIVTHAGAGTVYALLERGCRFLVVPNLDRHDKHQKDMAYFVEHNGYAQVCWTVSDVAKHIKRVLERPGPYRPYKKDDFNLPSDLQRLVCR